MSAAYPRALPVHWRRPWGAEAVVLAGSRASSEVDASSDWDLTVYYRADVDLTLLAAFGEVYAAGSWGRLMNGGAWLTVDGVAVDVILRDLAVVEHWTTQAEDADKSSTKQRDGASGTTTARASAPASTTHVAHRLRAMRSIIQEWPRNWSKIPVPWWRPAGHATSRTASQRVKWRDGRRPSLSRKQRGPRVLRGPR